MNLQQITPDRFTNSRLLVHEAAGRKLLIKVYLGEKRDQRRELEARKLAHWRREGFTVPELIELSIPGVSDPYLVMEFISGTSLKHFLRSRETAVEEQLATLSELFQTNHRRHMLVRSRRDLLLIHTDPNTDNLILRSGKQYFLDFEHSSRITEVSLAIANEVGTFVRRAIRDLGGEHCRAVIERLLSAYRNDAEIFDRVEALTLDRPFQPLHRLKDRWKRLRNARVVTRYDVVDCLRRLRARPAGVPLPV
jgi:tRNA A-37 threonylcarbamoyl transferase component Bud32